MNKSITILDEEGKFVGETYPKRANGLVKKGRAKYVGETTIRMSGVGEEILKKEPGSGNEGTLS